MSILFTTVFIVLVTVPALSASGLIRSSPSLASHAANADPAFFMGLLAGGAAVLWSRRFPAVQFFNTLQHEQAHAVVAFLLGAVPRSMSAGQGSGYTSFDLKPPLLRTRCFLISIAPYFISPLLLVAIAAGLATADASGVARGAAGWLLGIALALPLVQYGRQQTDLRRWGFVPATAVALWLWSGTVLLSLTIICAGTTSAVIGVYTSGFRSVLTALGDVLS